MNDCYSTHYNRLIAIEEQLRYFSELKRDMNKCEDLMVKTPVYAKWADVHDYLIAEIEKLNTEIDQLEEKMKHE